MNPTQLEFLQPDPEAGNWLLISLFAFWLRHPSASTTNFPMPPGHMEEAARPFKSYGYELAVLEHDLVECVNELRTGLEQHYTSDHRRKKFAVVYHTVNFYVRVHKLIENLYRLLAHLVGLDHERERTPGERAFQKQVRDGLIGKNLQVLSQAVSTFEREKWVRETVDARHRFVHRYLEDPEWPMLHPKVRFWDSDKEWDPMGWAKWPPSRQELEGSDLDRYARQKVGDLSEMLASIRHFRDRLRNILWEKLRELPPIASAMSRGRW